MFHLYLIISLLALPTDWVGYSSFLGARFKGLHYTLEMLS